MAKATGTCNSIAVIVECIRFLRKQVTGGRNGLAGKAEGARWRETAGTYESEDLQRAITGGVDSCGLFLWPGKGGGV